MSGARPQVRRSVLVDIVLQSPLWRGQPTARRVVRRAIAAAAAASTWPEGAEICVALTDDAGIRALNRDWRAKDAPTNVLSFPAPESPGRQSLGDIALAYETVVREAEAEGKPFGHHLAHLAVHGFLHLCGLDHETDAEAEVMEDAERAILASMRIPDPYAAPAHAIKAER